MSDETRSSYSDLIRRRAAAFLRARDDNIRRRWRGLLESAPLEARTDAATPPDGAPVTTVSLIDDLLGILGPMTDAIVEGRGGAWHACLANLAERAYQLGLPYDQLSRSLRLLKRMLMQLIVQTLEADAERNAVCDVIEEEIDECRVIVNQYYNLIHQELLRRSEGLNRFLLNNIYDAVLLVDAGSGLVNMANTRALVMTEYSHQELVGGQFERLFPDAGRAAVLGAVQQASRSGSRRLEDLVLLTRTGETRPVEMQLTPVPAADGGPLVQVAIRAATGAGIVSEDPDTAFLRAFVTDTAEAVLALDLDERIRSWNKGAEQVFGYTSDEMLNRPLRDLLPPEALAAGELQTLTHRLETDQVIRNYECQRQTKDGRRIDIELTRTVIHDPRTGRRIGTSAVARDITEKKRLQREAQEKTRQLEITNGILEATSRSLDPEAVYQTIARRIRELLPCDALLVGLLGPAPNRLSCRVLVNDGLPAEGEETVVELDQTVQGEAINTREAIAIGDWQAQGPPLAYDRVLREHGFRSALVTPLVSGNQVLGTLLVLHREPHQYTDAHRDQMHHLGNHIAIVLENGRQYEEQRRRASQFELISQVGARAIASIGGARQLMEQVVHSIQRDFGFHDVAIYEVDGSTSTFRLQAQAGPLRDQLAEGYQQSLETGVFGRVLDTQQSYLCNDTLTDPFYFDPQPDRAEIRSELCVPIRVGPHVYGVLDVESQRPWRFDALDVTAMEVLASLLARWIEADTSMQQTRTLEAMRQNIMEAVPSALLVLNENLEVEFVNRRYLEFFGQPMSAVMSYPAAEVFPPELLKESHFFELVEQIRRDHKPIDQREVCYRDFDGNERYADVRLRLVTEYQTSLIVMIHDATTRLKRFYQLTMMQEISEEMQLTLHTNRLLEAILTCVTAGPGFGFNRASLFLHEPGQRLVERLRVGPRSATEAGEIWQKLRHKVSIRQILREQGAGMALTGLPPDSAHIIPVPADDPTLSGWRTPIMMRQDDTDPRPVASALRQISGAPEVLVVPLVSQDSVLGLVVADNLFTQQPISLDNIRMLSSFANQAGVALANAQSFEQLGASLEQLRQTQAALSRAERLAGIGSVAAHVAHEIRNPLVSIGGFARRIARQANDPDYVASRTNIIVQEVERLEQILKNVMDFTAPGAPHLAPVEPNRVIEDVLRLEQFAIEESGVTVTTSLAEDLPTIAADRDKLLQVVLNLVRNGVQALDGAGELRLTSNWSADHRGIVIEVADNGPGIPSERLEEIFNPFFTNKADGTGLGLAVSRKIVNDHGGELTVSSYEGEGATFRIHLPLAQDTARQI